MNRLEAKKILIAVSGGIAAYKVPEIIREFRKKGADVFVVMTESAKKFVTPFVLEVLSGHSVFIDMFESGEVIKHIDLARMVDVVVVVPATANTIGKYANGIADNLLLTVLLATKAPVVLCPAMNTNMWENELVQGNLRKLKAIGVDIVEPELGELACGVVGVGRLSGVSVIVDSVYLVLFRSSKLIGKKVLITAGATREYADPIRFLTNSSSGKMGMSFALVAMSMGAEVTVVVGESVLNVPVGVNCIRVINADEMNDKVLSRIDGVDVFISTAAVCDYKFKNNNSEKLSKSQIDEMVLISNVDVLYEASKFKKNGQVFIGFALETESNEEKVKEKMDRKKLDYVICNSPQALNSDFVSGYCLSLSGKQDFDEWSKIDLAKYVLGAVRSGLSDEDV